MLIYAPSKPATSIPVIDLGPTFESGEARARAAYAIHGAARETGFFYIANHRVSSEFVDAQFLAAREFFDLPLETKMKLHMKLSSTFAGYEPIGAQTLDSQDEDTERAPPDLKEGFHCGLELPDDNPYAQKSIRGLGHNQWPDLP